MMWTQCIVGICVDLALFGLPVWVIQNKMIRGSKAFKVILVFCVGLFAIITGIVRFGFIITTDYLYYQHVRLTHNPDKKKPNHN